MTVARDERHRYGQHYTPQSVARLLAAFAVRSENDLVFDPSCGDGRLLLEALRLKREVAPRRKSSRHAGEVYGVDRSTQAIEIAAQTGAQVAVADFFNIAPAAALTASIILPAGFDAIIGNPPYIRQELMGTRDKQRIARRLKLDRAASDEIHWPRWSGRSDIYVYFFAHATRFLKPGGRLVFLTASSWLDVAYGAALREFMLANFRVIAVIESTCESFFEDASINTVITVLEREHNAKLREANPIRFVQLTRPLAEIAETADSGSRRKRVSAARLVAKEIERERDSIATDAYRIRVVEQARLIAASTSTASSTSDAPSTSDASCRGGPPWPPLLASASSSMARGGHGGPPLQGWGKYLRADDVFFRVLEGGRARLHPLSDFARVRFGVKTGANEFFYVKEEEQGARGKEQRAKGTGSLRALSDVASVRRGLTTGANEFFYLPRNGSGNSSSPTPNPQLPSPIIEPQYLSPVVFSLKEISGILLDRSQAKRLFFNCQVSRAELAGTGALDYIKQGERDGFHRRPTCSSREPWYAVARTMKPAPLIFPSKVGERWVVALNQANVFEDKKLYGIFPASGVSKLVLAALLNSTWARYYAEITCRQMTGAQAIADIDVAVAEQIMIPDPRQLSAALKMKLKAALKALSRRPVYSVFEEVRRTDRRSLDDLTLQAMGFSESSTRKRTLDDLYEAVTRLIRSRLSKVT